MQVLEIAAIVVSIVFFVIVIDFVRRGLLKEKYSVLWISLTMVVFVLSMWQEILHKISALLGVAYPPSLLFLIAFMFVLLILLHFSVVISVLTERSKTLTQEVTLLKEELNRKNDLNS